jgi:hypothetical protein
MPSIGVLEHSQNPTDQPTRRIKRSGGQSLVNRGAAYWIKENVLLIMRAHPLSEVYANPASRMPKSTPIGGRSYIPSELPPAELPGVFVEGVKHATHLLEFTRAFVESHAQASG